MKETYINKLENYIKALESSNSINKDETINGINQLLDLMLKAKLISDVEKDSYSLRIELASKILENPVILDTTSNAKSENKSGISKKKLYAGLAGLGAVIIITAAVTATVVNVARNNASDAASTSTSLPASTPVEEVKVELAANMNFDLTDANSMGDTLAKFITDARGKGIKITEENVDHYIDAFILANVEDMDVQTVSNFNYDKTKTPFNFILNNDTFINAVSEDAITVNPDDMIDFNNFYSNKDNVILLDEMYLKMAEFNKESANGAIEKADFEKYSEFVLEYIGKDETSAKYKMGSKASNILATHLIMRFEEIFGNMGYDVINESTSKEIFQDSSCTLNEIIKDETKRKSFRNNQIFYLYNALEEKLNMAILVEPKEDAYKIIKDKALNAIKVSDYKANVDFGEFLQKSQPTKTPTQGPGSPADAYQGNVGDLRKEADGSYTIPLAPGTPTKSEDIPVEVVKPPTVDLPTAQQGATDAANDYNSGSGHNPRHNNADYMTGYDNTWSTFIAMDQAKLAEAPSADTSNGLEGYYQAEDGYWYEDPNYIKDKTM